MNEQVVKDGLRVFINEVASAAERLVESLDEIQAQLDIAPEDDPMILPLTMVAVLAVNEAFKAEAADAGRKLKEAKERAKA